MVNSSQKEDPSERGQRFQGTPHASLFLTAFTNTILRFEVHFSCFVWVLRRNSISGHVWYGLRTNRRELSIFPFFFVSSSSLYLHQFLTNSDQFVVAVWAEKDPKFNATTNWTKNAGGGAKSDSNHYLLLFPPNGANR